MECSCCGRDRNTMTLPSRDDVRLCRDCVEWLAGKLGVVSTPTLPVTDLREPSASTNEQGFRVRVYKTDDDDHVTGSLFVSYDDQSVFDLDVVDIDPAANRAGCYLHRAGRRHLARSHGADGLPVTPIEDQPWGMREFTLTDPSGTTSESAAARVSAARQICQ